MVIVAFPFLGKEFAIAMGQDGVTDVVGILSTNNTAVVLGKESD